MSGLKKVILTTGGTGGHIFPALATAEELRQRFPDVRILFMGGQYGPEGRLAAEAGLEFYGLPVRGFLGRGLKALGASFRLLASIFKAWGRIRAFKPDLIIGFGGYAAAPALMAGRLAGRKVMLHEQNSIPGAVNRLMGRFAHKVCISLPDAASWFNPSKVVLTGNPVRAGIRALYEARKESLSGNLSDSVETAAAQTSPAPEQNGIILVLGGSQGARAINSAVLEDLPLLLQNGRKIRIQCGEADYARTSAAAAPYPADQVEVSAFIKEMDQAYGSAALAVCRAGASTVAELAASGLPALFVPFPQATHNHQLHNARQVEKLGAAKVLEQKDLAPGSLAAAVAELLNTPEKLREMSRTALALARPDAAATLVREAELLVN